MKKKNTQCSLTDSELSELSIDEIARVGAQELLRQALEAEFSIYMEKISGIKTQDGLQAIVRNGYHKARTVVTSAGSIAVSVPRSRNRIGTDDTFTSAIVPPYMRKSLKVSEAIPLLYLKGISTGNMEEALQGLLGDDASGLSASTVSRLKEEWKKEFEQWEKRSFKGKQYCYIYADGIYTTVRSSEKKLSELVVIGVLESGVKELITVASGYRESTDDWSEVLRSLKARGLESPDLAIGDGALGFWGAMRNVFPETEWQRCWVHKKRNVLNKMPKNIQKEASRMMDDIYNAEKRADADKAFNAFIKRFEYTQYKAVDCLRKDKEELLAFYTFPKQHWKHIRTTNPIESTFATVRLRTKSTRGMGTEDTTHMMIFKLLQSAEKRWQRIWGYNLIPFVMKGEKFEDGEMLNAA